MTNISHRNNITDLLSPGSIGCELGIFEGNFSETLLSSNQFSTLYLVDLFTGPAWNFGKHYPDSSVLYNQVTQRFLDNKEVSVIKQDSLSFLRSTNTKFDFIYIDTVHSYNLTSQELIAAQKCIKLGGYICGHDYCSEFSGVIDAVTEFSGKYSYKVMVTQEKLYPSFIIEIK